MKRPLFALALAALPVAVPPLVRAQSPAPQSKIMAKVEVPPIAYKARTLPNGLKVFTSVDKTTPNVTVQVWYGVGAKDDPAGRSGFAHLFEHLMFKSTRNMPAEFMDRLTEDVGGFNNASTADDYTEYHEVIPANHLERLLWAESERMGSLVVDEANFKSERDVVKEELRQRVLASPYGRLQAWAIPSASFTTHPYKRSAIGSIEDLDAATVTDVRAFHATYYRPDNAALIIVGNFDPAQVDAWVNRYFGPLTPPKAALPRVTAKEPPRTGPRTVNAYGPNVPLPAVAVTWLAPDAADKDAPALTVADAILSSGESSRLFTSLVYDQQVATNVFSSADLRQQPGLFMVGAVLASGKTVDQAETGLRAQVARLRDGSVAADELAKAKNILVAGALRERETVEDRASSLGYALTVEGDAARANDSIQRLQAVTAADVQRVARRYLPDDRRVVIRYQSEDKRPPGTKDDTAETVGAPEPTAAAGAALTLAPPDRRAPPPPVGAAVKATLPAPVERTLSNGLRVIVAHSTDLPLVAARLTVRTGGAADPEGKAGLADLTASLLTQGAGGRSATQVAQAIEALGAEINTGAGWDGSSASVNVMADKLRPAMAILADVVQHPTFAPEELERLRQRALDGLQVELQEPGSLARYVTAAAVFGGAPYGHALGGTPASLKRIGRDDVTALHRAYYRPDNAVLVLAGDITPEAGFALAEATFGGWARPAGQPPATTMATIEAKARVVVVDLPGTGQAAVTVALPAIARSDPRFYPGIVANNLLGGGYSSRLNQEVRIKRGLSYGAASSLDARRFTGPFAASAQTKNESAPEVADLILAELGRLRTETASQPELTARKAVLVGGFGRSVGTVDGLSSYLSNLALQAVPLSEINRYEAAVQAVSDADVRRFAAEALDPAKATVVVVGDAKLFADKLKVRFPAMEVIPAASLNLDSPTLQ